MWNVYFYTKLKLKYFERKELNKQSKHLKNERFWLRISNNEQWSGETDKSSNEAGSVTKQPASSKMVKIKLYVEYR